MTAASVMISASGWRGTSMMKQWLMRRAVRMPAWRDTTALINSSVWRLPFIRASARPAVTSSTALVAESWLCSVGTISKAEISRPARDATSRMRASGPTRIGSIRCSRHASTALPIDTSSQGCATATLIVASACAALIRRSYLACGSGGVGMARSGMCLLRLHSVTRAPFGGANELAAPSGDFPAPVADRAASRPPPPGPRRR